MRAPLSWITVLVLAIVLLFSLDVNLFAEVINGSQIGGGEHDIVGSDEVRDDEKSLSIASAEQEVKQQQQQLQHTQLQLDLEAEKLRLENELTIAKAEKAEMEREEERLEKERFEKERLEKERLEKEEESGNQSLVDNDFPKPPFSSLSDMFIAMNSPANKLKYVLCKNMKFTMNGKVITTRDYAHLIDRNNVGNINDVDILVSSTADFEEVTGAKRKPVTSTGSHYAIFIGSIEVIFDLHYVGDNFVDEVWERDIVEHGIVEETGVMVPSTRDEMFLTLYHMLVRKSDPLQSEYLPRVKELIEKDGTDGTIADLESEEKMMNLLKSYFSTHSYSFKRPLDPNVGFHPPV